MTDRPRAEPDRPHRALVTLPRADAVLDVTHLVPGQLVRLRGRLDVHTVADVRIELRVALAHGTGDLEVELAEVELGDTTGLGVLLGAHRRATRAGRRLVLVGVGEGLQRLLVATRLARVLHQARVGTVGMAGMAPAAGAVGAAGAGAGAGPAGAGMTAAARRRQVLDVARGPVARAAGGPARAATRASTAGTGAATGRSATGGPGDTGQAGAPADATVPA